MTVSTVLGAGLPHGLAELAGVALSTVAGVLVGLVAIGKRGTTPQAALIVTLATLGLEPCLLTSVVQKGFIGRNSPGKHTFE